MNCEKTPAPAPEVSTETMRALRFLVLFIVAAPCVAPGQSDTLVRLNRFVENKLRSFPVPPAKSNLLFYLQRNKNTNTVVYEANLLPDGKLNPEKPVHVYWIRYTEGNEIKELNWIQRWLAYGVDFEPAPDGSGDFVLKPVALNNHRLTVTVGKEGRPAAYITLDGQRSRLTRIYAEASETSWLPTVKFVQLKGEAVSSGQPVYEYIFPKKN